MTSFTAAPRDGAAWVTGASSGIGRSLALALASEGFTVYATARSEHDLERVSAAASGLKGTIICAPGDVCNAKSMADIVGRIDSDGSGLALAVLNAGVYIPVYGETLKVEDFDRNIAVNFSGVVNGLVPSLDAMKKRGKGQLAIVSSVTGYGGMPTSAAYGATKAALINMAESLKFDLDKLGVRIQVINPGFIDTPATAENAFAMPALMQPEDAAERIARGLKSKAFEITFPRRFTYGLKLLQFLPYTAYFAVMNAATGWKNRPLKSDAD